MRGGGGGGGLAPCVHCPDTLYTRVMYHPRRRCMYTSRLDHGLLSVVRAQRLMRIEGSCWVIREEGGKRLTATGKRAQGKKMKGGKTMLIRMQKTLEGRQGEGRKASVARTQREGPGGYCQLTSR